MVWKLEFYCQTLLNNFIVETHRFLSFTLLFLTLLVYLQIWFWNKMPEPKRQAAGSFSKYERRSCWDCIQKLVLWLCALKTSNLSVSKVRLFSDLKPSHTISTPATHKFKRKKALTGFKIEIWWMDLAYVDKLAKDNYGVKSLLVHQNLFVRTIQSKEMKTKASKETVRAFLTMNTKKKPPTKTWIDKGTGFAEEFKILCKAEGIQIYSTITETKAALAERTIRSLKNLFNRYTEDFACKYINKLSQFVTTVSSRISCSKKWYQKMSKNPTFCPFFTATQYENIEKPSLRLETEFAAPSNFHLSEGAIGHSLHGKFFEVLKYFSDNLHIHTKGWQVETIRRKFYQKNCLRHCPHTLFHDQHGHDRLIFRWRHEGPIAALFPFRFKAQSWKLYFHWTVHDSVRHLGSYNSDHCSKSLFIVFTLSWETAKKTLYICPYHQFRFDF